MIEDRKRFDYDNSNNKNRISKSSLNLNYTNQVNNSFYGSKKLMKLNSGAILNSLADYSLNNLEDKMLQLDIKTNRNQVPQQHQQQLQSESSMYKNVSFDSIKNLNNRKLKHNNSWNDQFEAYRLENDQTIETNNNDTKQRQKKETNQEENSKSNENNTIKTRKETEIKDEKTTTLTTSTSSTSTSTTTLSTSKPKKKPNRHHHHRKRHNKNKDSLNKKENIVKKSKSNNVILDQENQDSLSAFDFSNTDEFWEDDIVANSELIGTDSFHLMSHRSSPISHFITIDLDEDSI